MTRRRVVAIGAQALALVLSACGCDRPPALGSTVNLFAAASLADVATQCAREFESQHPNVKITLNFAGSSTLARQIDAGAPCDVFISANDKWIDWLRERNRIAPGSIAAIASNRLVLVVPKGRAFAMPPPQGKTLADLFDGRIAIGDPQHVPAGIYARDALRHFGWWSDLQDRLAPSLDVREALKLVERGETPAGIVYATDARGGDQVEVIWTFPPESHAAIRYLAARCTASTSSEPSAAFISFLVSPRGSDIFRQHGFDPAK